MDDLIEEFLAETNESMAELDLDIVNLEQNPNDEELIGKIFRLVHTVKGTCGFLGLPRLEMVAHRGENVLGRFRDKDLEVKPEFVTLILEAFDRIKEIVTGIEETGSEPEGDDTELMAKLDAVYETGELPSGDAAPAAAAEEVAEAVADESFDIDDYEPIRADSYVESSSDEETADAEAVGAEAEDKSDDMPDFETLAKQVAEQKAAEEAKQEEAKQEASAGAKKDAPQVNASLRVNVQVLENLMTMVSELVLTRNQLLQILRAQTDSEFAAPLQRLNQVVSELQEGVMQTRMQPIGNAWGKLPRIIRDLSIDLGKKINLEMRGKETELDRQVLDLIKDPLTHMIRNSGDHGIEMPADRIAAGKREEGTILLNAYHEGGHIIIEISDDGRGLNLDKIKEKALKNGVVSESDLADMSDQQIQQFIFAAGFSTAEQVTAVSGRGVGMDVVRTNIEKIGGTIELKSVEGKGSTFTIKIPLTLAIVSALIVESAQELYAIPQLSVQELVRASKNSEHRIENIKGTPVLRLRDRLLPLVSLRDLLQLQDPVAELPELLAKQEEGANTDSAEEDNVVSLLDKDAAEDDIDESYIVVIQVGSNIVGLIVDRVYDTEEIVVKPVSPILKHIDLFAGNTILGDGSVIMILDPNGITNNSMGEISVSDTAELGRDADENAYASGLDKKISFLVFDAGAGAPKAVPLSLVSRLEEVAVSDIEVSGDQRVVQYRGKLMPLIPFSNKMKVKESGNQAVLVFTEQDRSMGLMVENIIDIVEETMEVQLGADQKGLLGSAVINGKAMDVIDVGYFLGAAHSDWYISKDTGGFDAAKSHAGEGRSILLVDDSAFFQNMITPLLNVAGYDVHNVSNAQDAVELCNEGKLYDLIISDIEMPGMDGFEFAQIARADASPWKDVPIVALSAHSAPSDLAKGRSVGFTDYVAKFDRDALLDSIAQTFAEMGE